MKCTHIAKGALALVLGMMTSTVLAASVYEESFESLTYSNITENAGWTAGADDVSTVVEATYTPPAVGTPLAGTHAKVLQLNTEGGTLTNAIGSSPSFASANLFVDTMVKCVPSEDTPVFNDPAIKVAVYAKISETGNSTNLAIYHGVYNAGVPYATNTVTDLPADPDAWYRVTIELANGTGDYEEQVAKISINGVPVTNAAAYSDDWDTLFNLGGAAAPDGGPWFLSAAASDKYTISQLQFKGTGFIDDLVVTADDPFQQGEPPADPFGITQSIGENGTANDTAALVVVQAGGSTSLTYTADAFYRIATLSTNGTTIAAAADQTDYTLVLAATNDVVVTFATLGTYTDGNVDWFVTNGWGEVDIVAGLTAGELKTLEMLNVAATNAAAGGTITVTGIEIAGNGDVNVTVHVDRTMSVGVINGNVCLYGWTDLGETPTLVGAADVAGSTLGSNEDLDKTFTFTAAQAAGKTFFKAVIEYVADR